MPMDRAQQPYTYMSCLIARTCVPVLVYPTQYGIKYTGCPGNAHMQGRCRSRDDIVAVQVFVVFADVDAPVMIVDVSVPTEYAHRMRYC